jgi:hypothetical protein
MHTTSLRAHRATLIATVVLIFAACSTTGPSLPAHSSEPATSSADAWLVVGRPGEPSVEVILASTGESIYELPLGVPDKLWGQVVATAEEGSGTVVEEIMVQPDLPARRSPSIEGPWRLPTIGNDVLPVGVSADGSTTVLVEAGESPDAETSRFAILEKGRDPRLLELSGSVTFDVLSPDGSILYVIEHLPGPPEARYQVRAVEVATGQMRDEIIVDKRNLDASMGGWPMTQLRHEDGVVFTLYRASDHTFIHALNSQEAWAVCLGLPMIGADDQAAAADWGLGETSNGGTVYAVNATLGVAVAIDPGELSIRAATRFDAPRAAATISLAKVGHQEAGPVGRRVVVAPDGSTIYAAGAGGIVQIRAEDLSLIGPLLEGASVDALALTPDGSFLYALMPGEGRIVRIDLATGQVVGNVPGDGFDRLVAIVPW